MDEEENPFPDDTGPDDGGNLDEFADDLNDGARVDLSPDGAKRGCLEAAAHLSAWAEP
jgi:hypothetical protein